MKLTQPQYQLMLFVLANKPNAVPAEQRQLVAELRELGHIAMNGRRYVVTGRGGCALRVSGYAGSLDGVAVQPREVPIRWRGSAAHDARSS
jgi:hypothetical protein